MITLEQFNRCDDIVKARILSDLQSRCSARRETVATAALQGLLAAPNTCGSCEEFAKDAVEFADALILALDSMPLPATSHANP